MGKYGSFHANQIIGRPYHLTFEILDRSESSEGKELRIVSAAELHADALIEQSEIPAREDGSTSSPNSDDFPVKSNANIEDDPLNQKLTMAEIEALKQDQMGSSKDLIAKIMASHSTLDQKTAFSLAKYHLRKNKKYMRRFCVIPLDVATLTDWMMNERDSGKILELRNETLSLMASWANVHSSGFTDGSKDTCPASRFLVVDDTGGLIVAMLAERMGVLYPSEETAENCSDVESDPAHMNTRPTTKRQFSGHKIAMSAIHDAITLVHSNTQPNLALLRYFSFDSNNPTESHPLYTHLQTLSWLQLLDPTSDSAYQEPEFTPPQVLNTFKSSKRSNYHRKRRRWERTRHVVDSTRSGGFDGLIIASHTSTTSILHHLVPLLAGGSQIVVYSPHVEPLTEIADLYSTARRTAFINTPEHERRVPSPDFPVDPTLLLSPMVQTARARKWQVLPGRTHPVMTSRGGGEGYLFVATRVVPAEGRVNARGRAPQRKARKKGAEQNDLSESSETAGNDEDSSDGVAEVEGPSEKKMKRDDSREVPPETGDGILIEE